MTHQYELMVILTPELDERQVAPNLDKFLKVITNDGGSIDNVDIWGRRRAEALGREGGPQGREGLTSWPVRRSSPSSAT